jgi:hypothetical protein
MILIALPLSDTQAIAVIKAADAFGVEPWEMGVHILNDIRRWNEDTDHHGD